MNYTYYYNQHTLYYEIAEHSNTTHKIVAQLTNLIDTKDFTYMLNTLDNSLIVQ